jgi:hypothetical protein
LIGANWILGKPKGSSSAFSTFITTDAIAGSTCLKFFSGIETSWSAIFACVYFGCQIYCFVCEIAGSDSVFFGCEIAGSGCVCFGCEIAGSSMKNCAASCVCLG